MNRKRVVSWLLLGSVIAIVVVAANDTLTDGDASSDVTGPDEPDSMLTGQDVPSARDLPGTLVFVSQAGCRPMSLSLATVSLGEPGPSLECGLWVPPRGELAAVSLGNELSLRGSRVSLLRLGDPPELAEEIGIVRGEPSWSDDGRLLAWCTRASDTVVLDVDTDARRRLPGCRPTIAPDGSVLTRPARLLASTLLRDGKVLLDREALLRPFPADSNGPLDVVGYDQRPDGMVAVVTVRFEAGRLPRRILELWYDGILHQAVALPELNLPAGYGRLGDHVEFDPSGREVAVAFPGAGKEMVLVDLRSGRIVLGPTSQHGFAWSPDGGEYFALSTGDEIRVLGPDRGEPFFVLPVGAATLSWR